LFIDNDLLIPELNEEEKKMSLVRLDSDTMSTCLDKTDFFKDLYKIETKPSTFMSERKESKNFLNEKEEI